MALTPITVPGLDKPLYLPDDIPVEVKIIPARGNWWRGGKTIGHTKTTWHDTGNPKTNADAEYRWAAGGRQGGVPGGYNGIFDDRKIIITQPFDEVVGHAGNSTGNRTAYAFEQAWGGSVDFARSLEVGYALHGAVIAAKGWETDTALVQHHYWSGKHCPGQIRNRGLWSAVVKGVTEAASAAKRAASPDTPAPGPAWAKPAIIPELDAISKSEGIAPFFVDGGGARWTWVGDRVRVIKPTKRYQRANMSAESVGPDLKVGEEFDLDWVTNYEGADWGYTPWGTRILMADVERISDTKGEAA